MGNSFLSKPPHLVIFLKTESVKLCLAIVVSMMDGNWTDILAKNRKATRKCVPQETLKG